MKKIYIALLLSFIFVARLSAQNVLLETGFEGPGFDEGWTIGVSQGIDLPPQDYPSGLDPWEKWDITESTAFGYVHSGDSAAWIGGTLYDEPTHDWLMTPLISLPENESLRLYYWLWYHSEMTYVNRFYIMIYDNETAEWEQAYLLANDFNSPYHYIEEYMLDLNPWAGKEIKIAFVKNGTYQMAMDDIRVLSSGTDNISDIADSSKFEFYPNPADDFVVIKTLNNIGDIVTISDISGRTLITEEVTADDIQINVGNLTKGMYIIKVGDKSEKLIIRD